MAAAARPNPADGRVPCPLCGQLIHPIAGRCKHCKGDLRAHRSTRPAAIASLPSLLANAQGEPTYTQGNRNGHGNGVRGQMNGHGHGGGAPSGYAPMPHTAPVMPKALDDSAPILPPRPTGRMTAAASESGWFGRNWPLLVIGAACVAILVALVLMVIPHLITKKDDGGTKANKLAPAPERMDTDPLVPKDPRGSTDPWKSGGSATPDQPDIDIPDDPDVKDPDDPPTTGQLQGAGAIMMGMMRHACDRASACNKLEDEKLEEYCVEVKKWPVAPPPSSCPSAQRCFDHIDQMSCSGGFDDVTAMASVMHKFEDCVEAISCS